MIQFYSRKNERTKNNSALMKGFHFANVFVLGIDFGGFLGRTKTTPSSGIEIIDNTHKFMQKQSIEPFGLGIRKRAHK